MKILSGIEPLFCEETDPSLKMLADIVGTNDRPELIACLKKWMPLVFDAMVCFPFLYTVDFVNCISHMQSYPPLLCSGSLT